MNSRARDTCGQQENPVVRDLSQQQPRFFLLLFADSLTYLNLLPSVVTQSSNYIGAILKLISIYRETRLNLAGACFLGGAKFPGRGKGGAEGMPRQFG